MFGQLLRQPVLAEIDRRVYGYDGAISRARSGHVCRKNSARRVADKRAWRAASELAINSGKQLLLDKIQKAVAAFVQAAATNRKTGWCEIVYTSTKRVNVRNCDDD